MAYVYFLGNGRHVFSSGELCVDLAQDLANEWCDVVEVFTDGGQSELFTPEVLA